jgi:hypothetical protein
MENLRPVILMVPFDVCQIDVQCLVKDGTVEKYTYMMDDIKKCLLEPKDEENGEK